MGLTCREIDGPTWHPFELEQTHEFSAQKQIAEIDLLQKKILEGSTEAGDYCYVLIENLIAGAELRMLDFFDSVTKADRVMFLFL